MTEKNKKGVSHHHSTKRQQPNKATSHKNNKNISLCQFYGILKKFAKEQHAYNCTTYRENNKIFIKEHPSKESREWAKNAMKYDLAAFDQEFNEKIKNIENGATERILNFLGIVENGQFKIDRLETALKTFMMLFCFSNEKTNCLLLNGLEIEKKHVGRLLQKIRGAK